MTAGALAGRRLLVPASRLGRNVLAEALEHRGADVAAFPQLRGVAPAADASRTRALESLAEYGWVLVAGELSARHLLADLERAGRPWPGTVRAAAVGTGAGRALRRGGVEPDYEPAVHTARAVAGGLPARTGDRVLLVREEHATGELPAALEKRGLRVSRIVGYRVEVVEDRADLAVAFGATLDAVALANPTAVRVLSRAADVFGVDVATCLGGVPVAAVGPATAREAERRGWPPDLVAGGRLAMLVRELVALLARPVAAK